MSCAEIGLLVVANCVHAALVFRHESFDNSLTEIVAAVLVTIAAATNVVVPPLAASDLLAAVFVEIPLAATPCCIDSHRMLWHDFLHLSALVVVGVVVVAAVVAVLAVAAAIIAVVPHAAVHDDAAILLVEAAPAAMAHYVDTPQVLQHDVLDHILVRLHLLLL